jgi:SAM-dependent methyltransferase
MPRELTSDLAVLTRIPTAGRDVVDIGCGQGALVRELARAGARVVGIEISEAQLAAARAAAAAERDQRAASSADTDGAVRARYLVGRAEALPLDDASMDLAVFMRTLHHVPTADLMRALAEARRVLRPDGRLYVAEPLPEGSYFELSRLVEDEIEVRAAAQRVLDDAGTAGLERVATWEYEIRVRLAGVGGFHDHAVSVDPSRAEAFHVHEAAITDAFERLGEPGDAPGERWFSQPMRADVLRPVRT